MRGKAKQRVSLILVVTMVLGTALTGNTVFAVGGGSAEPNQIKINISKDSEQLWNRMLHRQFMWLRRDSARNQSV